MKRILELTGEPILYGGQEMFIMNVLKNINYNGLLIDVLTPYYCDNNDYKRDIHRFGGKLFCLNLPFSPNSLRFNLFGALLNFFRRNKYDVVHIHSGSISVLAIASFCARVSGVKKVMVHSHSSGQNKSLKYRILRFLSYPLIRFSPTDFLACSLVAGEWKYPSSIVRKKLQIIRNGISVEKYAFNPVIRTRVRKELFVDDDTLLIGHVGRFSYVKNHEFIVRILYRMKGIGIKCMLALVGGGELSEDIHTLVKHLDLEKDVLFIGEVSNVFDYMQAMDVFVFPSRWEGLPIVGVEAQTADLPIVASDRISREMKITEDVTYVSLDNEDKWIDTILRVYKRERKDNSAIIRKEGYDVKSLSEEIRNLYLR